LIIANPRSGRGRAARAAIAAREWLESEAGGGHQVTLVKGGPESDRNQTEEQARGAGLMVVAGGDGSVHHAVPVAMKANIPLYHLPCGNENLVAREFGMSRRSEDLSRAIAEGKVQAVDVGLIETGGVRRHFLIMVSFGPDASIVQRLAVSRSRATGHLAYARPLAAEFVRPHLPRMTVRVDGTKLVDDRRGILVVANCRQYAFRIDPCSRASMTDGKLDVIFMPCESRWGVVGWGWSCWRRRVAQRGAVCSSGAEVEVEGEGLWQVDGEHGETRGGRVRLSLNGSVRVLSGAAAAEHKNFINPVCVDQAR
jgi:diacylglycerol kinase (ATP)